MFQEDQQPALAGSERKAQIFHEQWYHLRAQQHHRWIPNSVAPSVLTFLHGGRTLTESSAGFPMKPSSREFRQTVNTGERQSAAWQSADGVLHALTSGSDQNRKLLSFLVAAGRKEVEL
jgi:hypothetical protein